MWYYVRIFTALHVHTRLSRDIRCKVDQAPNTEILDLSLVSGIVSIDRWIYKQPDSRNYLGSLSQTT